MFLFKEKGIRKQIVGFWTTKTYDTNVRVNGVDWGPGARLSGDPSDFTYNGLSTFWYWDGRKFQETRPKISKFRNIRDNGGVKIRSDDVNMYADPDRFNLRFCRDPKDFDLRVRSMTPNPPPLGYKRTLITSKIGFDALKIYHARFNGDLLTRNFRRKVDGSLYMQNICLNTPGLPWLWGVFHRDDGAYLTYFATFFGPLFFRRSGVCEPAHDNRFRFFNKNLNFTLPGKKTKRFKHARYNVGRQDNGLPTFEVSGSQGDETLTVRLKTLAKCTYAMERKKIINSKFFYNEFPSEVESLQYKDANGKVHSEDGSKWTGNCEYSWGFLLN